MPRRGAPSRIHTGGQENQGEHTENQNYQGNHPRHHNQQNYRGGNRARGGNHSGNSNNRGNYRANQYHHGNYSRYQNQQDNYRDNQYYQGNRPGNQYHQGYPRGNRGNQGRRGDRGNRQDTFQQSQPQDQRSNSRGGPEPHEMNEAILVVKARSRTTEQGTDKVTRIEGPIWASSKQSLVFAEQGEFQLRSNRDTTIIALNLIDHILDPENEIDWDTKLFGFRLSATCFFIAGLITGVNNGLEAIAHAINWSVWHHVCLSYWDFPPGEDTRRLLDTMLVTPRDVERGYTILHQHKEKFGNLVGGYTDELDLLPLLLGNQINLFSPTDVNPGTGAMDVGRFVVSFH